MFLCCIIKPPAYPLRKQIMREIELLGLRSIEQTKVEYTAAIVDTLYDHMNPMARACIAQKYGGSIGAALLLEAQSIEACCAAIGTESDPGACAPCSIRGRYGSRGDPESFGAWQWFENAVHRLVDERERLRDIRLIFPERDEGAG